jgi:acetyl-CoA synthetase
MERTFAAVDCAIADGWGQVELTGIVLVTGTSPRLDSARVVAHTLPQDALPHVADDQTAQTPGASPPGTPTSDGASAQAAAAAVPPVGPGGSGQVALQLPTPGSINLAEHLDRAWETGTADALVLTEDVVAIDSDGTPHFRGRADGVVSVSGQLISLSAVERALEEHPFVARALALRAHRENSGSTIVACVVIDGEPSDAVARDLIATVNAELGGLARPRMIVFVDRVDPPLERTVLAQALTSLIPSRTVWTARGWDEIRAAVRTTLSD